MSCVDETKCFTITWKIGNFSRSKNYDCYLFRSPVCKPETTDGAAFWRLDFSYSNLHLMIALINLESDIQCDRSEMSVLTSSGEVQLTNVSSCAPRYCIKLSTIFDETSNGPLCSSSISQDTLTLCCKIWQQKMKPGKLLLKSKLCEVKFLWNIESFNDNSGCIRSLHQQESMLLSLYFYKNDEKNTYRVRMELISGSGSVLNFLSCNIDIKGSCAKVVSNKHTYPTVSWKFNIELYPEKCMDGNLQLEIKSLIAENSGGQLISSASVSDSNTLRSDLLHLYKKTMLSDVTLKTEDKSFAAHKSILAARSEVFQAMFEKEEIKESQSGIVDIKDVDSETVDRFLVFIYSDTMEEDITFEEASALYYCADKYAVIPLKQKCAKILNDGMTVVNVCDLLGLAYRHSDENLMLCGVDFVRDHKEEVLSSSEWRSLEENNPQLTRKVLRQVVLDNAKK